MSTCSGDVLDHNIAVDEVGADPGGIEDCPRLLQEHHTYHVIANVALLVHLLWRERKRERGEREMGDKRKEEGRGREGWLLMNERGNVGTKRSVKEQESLL